MKMLVVFGTRPEAIKLAPVIRELQARSHDCRLQTLICVTGQHREMLDQVLSLFGLTSDFDLNVMTHNQSPSQVAAMVLANLEPVLRAEKPDWVVVQGDTTTTMAAALAAFMARVRVVHVEAGLRTWDKGQPFPEEMNRRVVSVVADLHCAPTEWARQNLLREGVPEQRIRVTGNTVIDALHWVRAQPFDLGTLRLDATAFEPGRKLILVTAHRRENFGVPLENVCAALRELAASQEHRVHVVYPVHLNPNVSQPVHHLLGDVPNITLLEPLDYLPLVHLLQRAYLVLTDSGGLQEEAPGLGVPVLVLRDVTERPEAVEAGTARLVGTDTQSIVVAVQQLLTDAQVYQQMARAVNPYGDGRAARRIVDALLED